MRELERLHADQVEEVPEWREQNDTPQSDESEEERHRHSRLVPDADLEEEDVGGVGEGGE